MKLDTRSGAMAVLVALSVMFLALAVWVKLYFPAQSAFADRLWDLFYLTFGGTLVILKSEANPPPPEKPAKEQ